MFTLVQSLLISAKIQSKLLLQRSQQLRRGLLAVALGVVLGPEPEILAGLLEGTGRSPAKLLGGTGSVGSQVEDVTGTAGSDLVGKVTADSGAESANHLVDGGALTGTQVPGADTGVVGAEVVEGLQVAVSEIEDVDVVTDGGAIVGVVVWRC